MRTRDRLTAFAPLTVLALAATGGAALGLRAAEPPGITTTDRTRAIHQLVTAPGVEFGFTLTELGCLHDGDADCRTADFSTRDTGVQTFDPPAADWTRTFERTDADGRPAQPISFRIVDGTTYTDFVGDCWVSTPDDMVPTVPAIVAVLRAANQATEGSPVRAPAEVVLGLLGHPRLMWIEPTFTADVVDRLPSMTAPVSLSVDEGDLVVAVSGLRIAREWAFEFPEHSLLLSRIASARATWRATPTDAAPDIGKPAPVCD